MKQYTTRAGDTFATVSRRVFGTEIHAGLISDVNPGAVEPLQSGTVLAVPKIPEAPTDKTPPRATGESEVSLIVGPTHFRYWSNVRIGRAIDNQDTIQITAPFEPSNEEFRRAFRPFSFDTVVFAVGGSVLFNGHLVDITPELTNAGNVVRVTGYSAPGILADCTPPASMLDRLEFDGMNLQGVADALTRPFGIVARFDAEPGPAFERVAIEATSKVLGFLADLARQRGLVMSSSNDGDLVFQTGKPAGNPVAIFEQGASPVVSVSPRFSPREYYTDITGMEPAILGVYGDQYTVTNPHLVVPFRPFNFTAPDVEVGDLPAAVRAKMGRMFGNMVSYIVTVDTWRDPAGGLWEPNTTVILDAPGAMVYGAYEFAIRAVTFERDGSKESAELELVLPGAFSGEIPDRLPWEGGL